MGLRRYRPIFYPLSFFSNKEEAKEDTTDKRRLNSNAQRKPSMRMPSINLSASKIISALITKRKRPSVITVIGRVKITSNGLINRLSSPRTRANMSASLKSGMCTPLSNFDNPKATSAVMKSLMMMFMMLSWG